MTFYSRISRETSFKKSLSTTPNMVRQLLRQKSCQKFSVTKTKKKGVSRKNSLFWYFNSRFVLKTIETPVFITEIF